MEIAKSINVPVPVSLYIETEEQLSHHSLPYPVIIKPNSTDGSFGMEKSFKRMKGITAKNVCHSLEELVAAFHSIRKEFGVEGAVLLQEYLPGKCPAFSLNERP